MSEIRSQFDPELRGIIKKNKMTDETYYIQGNIIYFTNILCEIAGVNKQFYEPAKLTKEGKELLLTQFKNVKLVK